jgi:hypothetical protein
MKNVRRFGWDVRMGAVLLLALCGVAACGQGFRSACQETHTCPPSDDPEAGGAGGESASEGGAAAAQRGGGQPAGD